MTVTIAQFRADLPAFSSATAYPDAAVQFWLNVAGLMLNADAWGDLLPYGTELYVAHNLSIGGTAGVIAAGGGTGANTGLMTSKQIDKVSASYDAKSATIEGGGDFNLTTWGTRYLQLRNLIGMGAAQLGVGSPFQDGGQFGFYPCGVP